MVIELHKANLKVAGLLVGADNRPAIFPTNGNDVASVEIVPDGAAWSTAVLWVRRTNTRTGPYKDFATAVSITTGAPMSGLLGISSEYIVVEATTGEGSDSFVSIYVHFRPSNIGSAITV